MERRGFIRDMLDVKVLILFVLSHAEYPVQTQQVYELCYQDDRLSYFDVCEALPQLLASGHVQVDESGAYSITEKGRENGKLTEDSISAPVLQRALIAVEKFNRSIRRDNLVRADILPRPDGEYAVVMSLDDERGNLMTLDLLAPSQQQARRLAKAFQADAEQLYQTVMTFLLEKSEGRSRAGDTGRSDNF